MITDVIEDLDDNLQPIGVKGNIRYAMRTYMVKQTYPNQCRLIVVPPCDNMDTCECCRKTATGAMNDVLCESARQIWKQYIGN